MMLLLLLLAMGWPFLVELIWRPVESVGILLRLFLCTLVHGQLIVHHRRVLGVHGSAVWLPPCDGVVVVVAVVAAEQVTSRRCGGINRLRSPSPQMQRKPCLASSAVSHPQPQPQPAVRWLYSLRPCAEHSATPRPRERERERETMWVIEPIKEVSERTSHCSSSVFDQRRRGWGAGFFQQRAQSVALERNKQQVSPRGRALFI